VLHVAENKVYQYLYYCWHLADCLFLSLTSVFDYYYYYYFVALDVSLGFDFLFCVCYVNTAYGCQIEINCIYRYYYY